MQESQDQRTGVQSPMKLWGLDQRRPTAAVFPNPAASNSKVIRAALAALLVAALGVVVAVGPNAGAMTGTPVIIAQSSGATPSASTNPSSGDGTSNSSGAWQKTGAMTEPRSRHTATLLPSGKVLVAGGCIAWEVRFGDVCKQVTDSTELYDPAKGVWAKGPRMKVARLGHSATLLENGKVLLAGGCIVSQSDALFGCKTTTPSTELYDPKSGRLSDTGGMKSSRTDHPAALIPSGPKTVCGVNCNKVLIVGNRPEAFGGKQAVAPELYDPQSGVWEQTALTPSPPIPGDCCAPTLSVLQDGTALLTGIVAGAALFNPAQTAWSLAPAPKIKRLAPSAVPLTDGSVLVAGGATGDNYAPTALVEVYDPEVAANEAPDSKSPWRPANRMSAARSDQVATALADGRVLVMGGGIAPEELAALFRRPEVVTDPPKLVASAELFNPRYGHWEPAGQMSTGRGDNLHERPRKSDFTASLLKDGRVLVAGGTSLVSWKGGLPPSRQERRSLNTADIYVPSSNGPAPPSGTSGASSKGGAQVPVAAIAGVVVAAFLAGLLILRRRR